MNVLVITSTFPRHSNDNQVPWLAQLVLRLRKRGIRARVYAPSYKGLRDHNYHGIAVTRFRYALPSMEILTHEEGAVFKLREKPWLYGVALFYLIFGIVGIFRMRRQFKFDVVHVHWPFPNGVFGIIAKRLFDARLILSFNGAEFTLMRRIPLGTTLLRFIVKNADVIVANSDFTKHMIDSITNRDIHVIPFSSGLSVQEKITLKRQQNKPLRLLFVGRLIERKGVSFLVDAVSHLIKLNVPVTADIVGSGPLYTKISEQIKHLDLVQYIRLHGEVDMRRLAEFYKQSDLFVLPAIVDRWGDTEGLGVVLVEAMSFGKPIVASRVGGIPSVVKHMKNGILVAEKNPKELADAIEKLFYNPKLRVKFGTSGLSYAKKYYNWESIIDKTIRLYRK